MNPPQVPVSTPSNPPTPSNNTVDPVQSWIAQHEQRDPTGKFVKSEHITNGQPPPNPQTTQTSPNPAPNGAGLPPLIQTNSGTSDRSSKGDYL